MGSYANYAKFNIELDEIDTLKKDCEYWRHEDAYSHPKPMIVEVYLDTSELSATQALVILDSRGSRWNVNEALESAASRAGLNMSYKGGPIVLERWKIALRLVSPTERISKECI